MLPNDLFKSSFVKNNLSDFFKKPISSIRIRYKYNKTNNKCTSSVTVLLINAGVKKNNDPRRIMTGNYFSTWRNDPQLKKNDQGVSFLLVIHEENDPEEK